MTGKHLGSGPLLDISTHDVAPSLAYVHTAGEVDMLTGHDLQRTLDDVVREHRGVVLDLREVTFLGVTGLRILHRWCESAMGLAVTTVAVVGDGPVRRALRLIALDNVLPQCGTPAEALDRARGPIVAAR